MFLFALCDTKSNIFHKPFIDESVASAMRGFEILVNDPKSTLVNQFPDDYSLFCVGSFSKETGVLTSKLDNLGSGRTVLRKGPDLNG
jgi:hypothetical protein